MTKELYFPDQVISEFTLTLLSQLGWYKINNFTGGLMKFGKNKGCEFLSQDCVTIDDDGKASSKFYNEFCSFDSINTCSPGRQSRGYCFTGSNKPSGTKYERQGWDEKYGIDFIEYCPVFLVH